MDFKGKLTLRSSVQPAPGLQMRGGVRSFRRDRAAVCAGLSRYVSRGIPQCDEVTLVKNSGPLLHIIAIVSNSKECIHVHKTGVKTSEVR